MQIHTAFAAASQLCCCSMIYQQIGRCGYILIKLFTKIDNRVYLAMPVCNIHNTWRQSAVYMIPAILLRFAFKAIFCVSTCAKTICVHFIHVHLVMFTNWSVQITRICRFLPFRDPSVVECLLKSPWGWFCPSLLTGSFPSDVFVTKTTLVIIKY